MFEMLVGEPPFKADNHIQLQKLIESTEMGQLIESRVRNVDLDCKQLLKGLLTKNPQHRLSFEQFFSHPALFSADKPEGREKLMLSPFPCLETELELSQGTPPFAKQYLSKSGTSSRHDMMPRRSWSLTSDQIASSGTSPAQSSSSGYPHGHLESWPRLILGALIRSMEETAITRGRGSGIHHHAEPQEPDLLVACRDIRWICTLIRALRNAVKDQRVGELALPPGMLLAIEGAERGIRDHLDRVQEMIPVSVASTSLLYRLSTIVWGATLARTLTNRQTL